jgi:hypothetical protein
MRTEVRPFADPLLRNSDEFINAIYQKVVVDPFVCLFLWLLKHLAKLQKGVMVKGKNFKGIIWLLS